MSGMPALSLQTSVTLAIALAKLRMPIPRELHIVLLQSISNNLEVRCTKSTANKRQNSQLSTSHIMHIHPYPYPLQGLSLRQLSIICWSICSLAEISGDAMQLRATSELQLLPRIMRQTQTHLERYLQQHATSSPSCNSADLLQLLTSFAKVSFLPDETWLEGHESCVVRLARQGHLTPAAASGILNGYKGLRLNPRMLVGVLKGMMVELYEQKRRRMMSSGQIESDGEEVKAQSI